MRILIANDDGIYSPGILALATAASRFGEVRIVAPDVEQSSASGSITSTRPMTYRHTPMPAGLDAFRVNGTPSDCVALGIQQWEKVDLVLSGINLGSNLGNAIWHSGTVAAARQASLLGVRGIAFSAYITKDEPDFESLKPHVRRVLELTLPLTQFPLLNVNFPEKPHDIRWTRQSVRHYDGKVIPSQDPRGRPIYWYTVIPLEPAEEGTDRWAVENNCISITPLRLELTDEAQLARAITKQQASRGT